MTSLSFYEYLLGRGLERRASQERMIRIVEELLLHGGIKLVEAPTGTGKTFGYLIPIITSSARAIVSTGTKVLQDQLKRDIEFLRSHYHLLTGKEVHYAVIKGKGNYLCIDRYRKESLQAQELADVPELMETDWDGDLTLSSVSTEVASRINVDDDYCTKAYRRVCPYRDRCFYWKRVKERERKARILVVNHALLTLKEFEDTHNTFLIIDEAHELDRYLTLASTAGVSYYWVVELASTLSRLLNRELSLEADKFFTENFSHLFKDSSEDVVIESLTPYMRDFEELIVNPIRKHCMEARKLVINDVRSFLRERLMVSHRLKEYLESTFLFSEELLSNLKAGYEEPDDQEEIIISKIKRLEFLLKKLNRLNQFLRLCSEHTQELGYKVSRKWSRKLQAFNYKIEIFPVFPKGALNPEDYSGVLLTSATVDPKDIEFTTGIKGDFYRLEKELDYSGVDFIVYDTNPKKEDWLKALKEAFEDLRTLYDKVLVLLTNRKHMELFRLYENVGKQGQDSLTFLIESFRNGKIKALIGLDSLWTGVDVKGEKGILMAKLPFDSPEEPLTYHRIRYLKAVGEDPFEYQRRKAFVRFRQGVGRLVRQKGDRGTIALCDNRIWRYREFTNFLKELGIKLSYLKGFTAQRT